MAEIKTPAEKAPIAEEYLKIEHNSGEVIDDVSGVSTFPQMTRMMMSAEFACWLAKNITDHLLNHPGQVYEATLPGRVTKDTQGG